MPGMDEAVGEFLAESRENLDQVDRDLVALESDPSASDTLARVFRAIHTIKGTCGFLGYSKLESVTHAGEGLLSRLRDREMAFTREIADALLAMVDAVRRMLASIQATGGDGDEDHSRVVADLLRLQERKAAGSAPSAAEPAGGLRVGAQASVGIRVDVDLLDRLMTLVGELVLTRNQILQLAAARRERALITASQRLNLITAELQEGVMRTRMQPLLNLGSRLPRHVRDLAAACGKKVRIEMEGMETELDRSILEAIKDPLTHLVRNAIDHGIEDPAAREAAGKHPCGVISLRARHEGGQVHITLSDDGAGVDEASIRDAAIRRGLVTAAQAERLRGSEALNLIFMPGLSTARQVTSVSGRGVGMDVVRTNIERIGGAVVVRSEKGKGSSFEINLPLTLAIVPALIVRAGSERYALPQSSLLELVRLEGKLARSGIETIQDAPVHRLRGNLVPIVYLGRELGALPRSARSLPGDGAVSIVVLRAEGAVFGLVVDGIDDTQEIVVKPLGRHLRKIPAFAGATILGDGGVALILDVSGLAQRARVIGSGRARAAVPATIAEAPSAAPIERRTLLLFEASDGGRMALPLSSVARLEEFPRDAVERIGSREVVQYRSEILPLLRISRISGASKEAGDRGPLHVVVWSDGGRSAGLVVDRIHDIVEEPLEIRIPGGAPGVAGSAIIQQRITEVLDLSGLLGSQDPALFETAAPLPVRS
jgi:two-component system, chemotaxis family, sensor kinase CheA